MKYVDASAVLRIVFAEPGPTVPRDALHVASAEILAAEAAGEPLEFWTHDERQAIAALSRGLTVRGT